MGRRGPKPLPKSLRIMRSPTTSVRQPPALGADPPVMPEGLSEAEQVCWRTLMSELATVPGLASQADRGVVELVARLEPMLRAAAVIVRESGSTLACYDQEGNVKFVQTRPEATFVLKTGSLLKGLYGELGLTPSGRSRVSLSPAAPASKLDRFLAERHGS